MTTKEILIVEDDEDIQDLYKSIIMASFDVELVQGFNGQEGLDAVDKHKPNLIILDLLMPVMDGEEFVRQLRHKRKVTDIPIIVCSVNRKLADELVDRKDVDAALPKLFQKQDMTELISKFLDIAPKEIPGA